MKKNRIWIYSILILGVFLKLTSCKNDEAPPPPLFREGNGVTDIDGNIYKTVIFGGQEWMAENLKTTRYRNGDLIGTTTPATLDVSSEFTPYQWAYDGNESNVATYDRLYNGFVIIDSRNVCPIGWHVATEEDWVHLRVEINGNGGQLKEIGTAHWQRPNYGATNESGFTALPGGSRLPNGVFENLGSVGGWWEASSPGGLVLAMNYNSVNVYGIFDEHGYTVSIRCIKD